jgi:hypothetical protein
MPWSYRQPCHDGEDTIPAKGSPIGDPGFLVSAGSTGYIAGDIMRFLMGSSQQRAIKNYRSRLGVRGMARFEVLGLDADRGLIRSLARRLAENGPDAARLRAAVSNTMSGEPPKRGGILDALRRSPMVGADLDLTRPFEDGRTIEL